MRAGGRFVIRVELPFHLRNLAGVDGAVAVPVEAPATVASVLDALEKIHPVLRGAIRDHGTRKRRPFLRFFADGADLSNDPPATALPPSVVSGQEPFLIVGAIAGG